MPKSAIVSNTMWFLISLGVIAILLIVIFSTKSIVQKKQYRYVIENSSFLRDLKELNKNYVFDGQFSKPMVYRITLDNKRKFDHFDSDEAFLRTFTNKREQIKNVIENITIQRRMYVEYKEKYNSIPKTIFADLPKTRVIKEKKFFLLENQLIKNNTLNPNLGVTLTVRWSYTSPAGRSHYEDYRTLEYQAIINRYKSYFNVDLSKVDENKKMEAAVQAVMNDMIDNAYSSAQIGRMFERYGVEATDKVIILTATSAGFYKQRKSDVFVRENIGSVNEMILASADECGLIQYDNSIKDSEYDEEIEKLEKSRKIVPISNLQFLKITRNLNYQGITYNDILEFDEKLNEYASKERFISVKTVIENVRCAVTDSSFDECFIYNLMKYGGLLHEIVALNKLFTKDSLKSRIDFLENLLGDNKSVNAFDLIVAIKEKYDVDYQIYSIIYDIDKNNTKLYYNPETEKVYSDKEYFYEEIL